MLVNSYPQVVGVDFSILAIRRARRKARRAGDDCQFYRGDVTHLAFLADPFDLALDIGCLHSLPPGEIRLSLFAPVMMKTGFSICTSPLSCSSRSNPLRPMSPAQRANTD